MKRGATEADAQRVLDYACDPTRGAVDCAPIRRGGERFAPNTKRDHAAWAIREFFEARRRRAFGHGGDRDASFAAEEEWGREGYFFPQRDCHFEGAATLASPGNYYLADGALVAANHRVDAAGAKIAVPREGLAFETRTGFAGDLTARREASEARFETDSKPAAAASVSGGASSGRPATGFKVWVGANPGAPSGCFVEASVAYDFDGDGRVDRVESFEPQGVPTEPDLLPVETKVLGRSMRARGDAFWRSVADARATLRLRSPNCPDDVNVWESAEAFPSYFTVPYE